MLGSKVNQHELRVIGMSRSGNHCIINWIMRQATGRVCFLNCAEGKSNPFVTARPLEGGDPFRVTYEGFDIERERAGMFTRKDLLVHSYEDSFLGHACSGQFEAMHDALVGPSARRLDLLVLRDPFNLFASRRKMAVRLPASSATRMWKQHAREFLGSRRLKRNRLLVNFNRWVASPSYRHKITQRLGLRFTDAGIDEVASCGGGSSFDGLRFNGRARQMPLFERWRHFADDPGYLRLLDHEMVRMAREIFAGDPGADALPTYRAHSRGGTSSGAEASIPPWPMYRISNTGDHQKC